MKKKLTAALLSLFVMASACIPSAGAVEFNGDISIYEENKTDVTDEITDASGFVYYVSDGNAVICGYNNTGATLLTIPSSIGGKTVTQIGSYAFEDFTSLKTVVMPDTVTQIGICSFSGCSSLTNVTFSKKLVHLSVYAFSGCTSLKTVNLPDTVETIYTGVFSGCTSLTSFHIPAALRFVGDGILFRGCPKLSELTFSSSIAMYSSKNGDINPIDSDHLYIPPSVTSISVNGGTLSSKSSSSSHFAISGFAGTYAEQFAKSQGITFLPIVPNALGDVDNSETIDAVDASMILKAYADMSTGNISELDDIQLQAADVNNDSVVNAVDASAVLSYYAYAATGGSGSLEEFLK